MAAVSQEQIAELEQKGLLNINVEGQTLTVEAQDVEIISEDMPGWLVTNEGNLTVALEVELTDELRREGFARELVNRIQNLRKESGLEITDHIVVRISEGQQQKEAIESFGDYVKTQVLANDIQLCGNDGQEVQIDELTMKIQIEKTQ